MREKQQLIDAINLIIAGGCDAIDCRECPLDSNGGNAEDLCISIQEFS